MCVGNVQREMREERGRGMTRSRKLFVWLSGREIGFRLRTWPRDAPVWIIGWTFATRKTAIGHLRDTRMQHILSI